MGITFLELNIRNHANSWRAILRNFNCVVMFLKIAMLGSDSEVSAATEVFGCARQVFVNNRKVK